MVDEACRGGSMVERGFRKAQVAGSSPARGSIPGVAQKVERRPSGSEAAGSLTRRPVQVLGKCPVCGKVLPTSLGKRVRVTCSGACRTAKSRKGKVNGDS